jgi:hypothetical protein
VNARRRITRAEPPGYAMRVGGLFDKIISSVNDIAGLNTAPLTLVDVLECMEEGKAVLASMRTASDVRTLAQVAVDSAGVVGHACNSSVIGLLASPNKQGKLSTAQVSVMANVSPQHVRRCKKRVADGELGTFGLTRRDSSASFRDRRSKISDSEKVRVSNITFVIL